MQNRGYDSGFSLQGVSIFVEDPRKGISHRGPLPSSSLTESEIHFISGFSRLLRAGIAPSPVLISQVAISPDGKTLCRPEVASRYLATVPDKLLGDTGFVADLVGPETNWPTDMPIQTLDDLGDLFRYYKERNRIQKMMDRLPLQLQEWMENNRDPSAFPELQAKIVAKTNPSNYEIDNRELIIISTLIGHDLSKGYKYPHLMDVIPDLQQLDEFKGMEPQFIPSFVKSAVYAVPTNKYSDAAVVRKFALQDGHEDPTKGMVVGELFKKLETTLITPNHTLAGISGLNLSYLLAASLPIEEMQRRIISQS